MDIISDYFEELWEEETGEEIPADILDTLLKNLERDASDLVQQELHEVTALLKVGSKGKSVKSLQKLLSPAQKAARLRSLKSAQKALKSFKNLKPLRKGSKAFKQLQKNVRAAGKAGKVGKNLKKGKGFFRGMFGLCKRFPKTCACRQSQTRWQPTALRKPQQKENKTNEDFIPKQAKN